MVPALRKVREERSTPSFGAASEIKSPGQPPLDVPYSFLFMRAQGQQLSQIASLIESGIVRPMVDREFPFEKTPEALAYVETGRVKGKVVIKVTD